MIFDFYKYQGTGNDFILIDDREEKFDINNIKLVASICERRMGIGADGLILLKNHPNLDFEMIYFNSDGNLSTFCGNGGRCIVCFAQMLKIITNEAIFKANDGIHKAKITNDTVFLQMQDVFEIESINDGLYIDTGSPHFIKIVDDLESIDVYKEGKKIRNSNQFKKSGVNVNFVEDDAQISIRTYERGVENETLSCGTGVVATAVALHYTHYTIENIVEIHSRGGLLVVSFEYFNGVYRNFWLSGDAFMVYSGEFAC